MALPTEASADNKVCYWNAEGLPYSKAPPPDAAEPLFEGGPAMALYAMFMAAPQLFLKAACGTVEEIDLAKPREVHRSWGCAPDSSMAEMIEGLPSGGVFVSGMMSSMDYLKRTYPEEFREHCPLLTGIDPICHRVSGNFPKDVERYPQCVDAWPKIKAFGEVYLELEAREKTALNRLANKDEELIMSATHD